MLHTLATTLLAAPMPAAPNAPALPSSSAAATSRAELLLDLVPSESSVVFVTTDLAAWSSKPEDEYGAWERFFTDPRLMELFDADEFDELGEDGVGAALTVFGAVEGLAVGFEDPDADVVELAGAMLLADDFRERWTEALEPFGGSIEDSELDGQATLSLVVQGQTVLSLAEVGGAAVFAASEEPSAVTRRLAAQLDALEDGTSVESWWADYAGRTDGALFECYVDFAMLAAEDPEMEGVDEWIHGMHFGVAVGEGDAGELTFGLALVDRPGLASIAGAFGEASVTDLGAVPEGATIGSVAHIDLLALVEGIVEIAEEVAPGQDVQAGFDQVMAIASEAIGIDVEGELLGSLTGDWVMAQWIDGSSLVALAELDEDSDEIPDGFLDAVPVIAARLTDPEPYYELIETAVGLLGPMASVEETDLGSTLVLDAVDGVSIRAMVTDDWIVLGLDEARVNGLASGVGGAFSGEQIERLDDVTDGAAVSVTSMETVLDIVATAFEAAALEEEMPDEAFEVLDIMSDHLGGSCATDVEVTATGIVFRTLTF